MNGTEELAAQFRSNTKTFFGFFDAKDKPELVVPATKEETKEEEEDEEDEIAEKVKKVQIKEPEKSPVKPAEEVKVETKQLQVLLLPLKGVLISPQDQDVRFACKFCRKVLFNLADVLPHTEREKKELKGRSEVEDKCQLMFVKPMSWMDVPAENDFKGVAEGKLTCPECEAKLGKWNRALGLQCSCGTLFTPAYSIKRKTVDVVLPSDHVDDDLWLEDDDGQDEPGNDGKKKKKARAKKVKKQGNNSNLSSFRNKSFNVKAPSKSKKDTGKQADPAPLVEGSSEDD